MKNLRITALTVLFIGALTYADSPKLPEKNEALICHQMELHKRVQDFEPPMNTYFVYKEYFVQPDDRSEDIIYNIKKNNVLLNSITLKDVGTLIHTKANLCEDLNNSQYIVIVDEFEGEGGDDGAYSGEGILILEISKNKVKKITKKDFFDDIYTPQKLLNQQKFLPITYSMFSKDGGLYMKVGSTYKSNIITLKKPTSVK
ncbi:MAG: hypothetical protein NT103_00405 [Campylobacterales bacterium]|nr:hypothetical protein [Campylobacterales bacterium]